MVTIRSVASTALILLLAGVLGFGCAKRKEPVQPKGLHGVIESFNSGLDGKENLYNRFEHEKTEVDSFKPQTYAGDAYKYFQLGKVAQVKGIATNNQKMLDSAKNCYNKMFIFLDNQSDSGVFSPDEINKCSSDFITSGPLKLYFGLAYLTKNPQYADSTKKYLTLAANSNNSETPSRILLDQNFTSAYLNELDKNYSGSINDLKNALGNLQNLQINPLTKKQNEAHYLNDISRLKNILKQKK